LTASPEDYHRSQSSAVAACQLPRTRQASTPPVLPTSSSLPPPSAQLRIAADPQTYELSHGPLDAQRDRQYQETATSPHTQRLSARTTCGLQPQQPSVAPDSHETATDQQSSEAARQPPALQAHHNIDSKHQSLAEQVSRTLERLPRSETLDREGLQAVTPAEPAPTH